MAPFDRLSPRRLLRGALRELGDALSSWLAPPQADPVRWSAPVRAPAPSLTPSSTTAVPTAWREHALAHGLKWLGRVRDDASLDAAEHTRRVRVAIRRMRALLPVIAAGDPPHMDRCLRKLGRRLGDLREHDLALEHTAAARAIVQSPLEHAALEELEGRLRDGRTDALVRARQSRDAPELVVELEAFERAIAAIAEDDPRARRIAAESLAVLGEQLHAAIDPAVVEADLEPLHTMRIAARRLRYVAEFFEPCLDAAQREQLARALDVQRAIGSHRDAAVWHELLAERVERAQTRGRITFARGLAEALASARSGRERAFAPVTPALERVHAAFVRRASS